jgi:hypothetical protein
MNDRAPFAGGGLPCRRPKFAPFPPFEARRALSHNFAITNIHLHMERGMNNGTHDSLIGQTTLLS